MCREKIARACFRVLRSQVSAENAIAVRRLSRSDSAALVGVCCTLNEAANALFHKSTWLYFYPLFLFVFFSFLLVVVRLFPPAPLSLFHSGTSSFGCHGNSTYSVPPTAVLQFPTRWQPTLLPARHPFPDQQLSHGLIRRLIKHKLTYRYLKGQFTPKIKCTKSKFFYQPDLSVGAHFLMRGGDTKHAK